MMKISVWDGGLSDSYLKQVTQLRRRLHRLWWWQLFPRRRRTGVPRSRRSHQNQKANPFLGTRYQPRDAARHHGNIYERAAGRRKRTGKQL